MIRIEFQPYFLMKFRIAGKHAVPFDAPPEDYLPGFDSPDIGAAPPRPTKEASSSGWWVKRSAKQTSDASGQPAGFTHRLMYGARVIKSGVGADCARAFQQQAEFLAARGVSPECESRSHMDDTPGSRPPRD